MAAFGFKDRWRWATKFATHGRKIASITPSSRWLSRAMCRDVDSTRPQIILELGAGTGPVTEMVHSIMHPKSRLLSVELDEDLHQLVSERCPEVEVIHGSAADLDAMLDDRDIERVDCFLSCLPIPSMPQAINHRVFDTWSRRCQGDTFTQITQIPWYYQSMYRKVFEEVAFTLVARNCPPAGVYHCRNLRDNYSVQGRLPGKRDA